MHVLRKKLLYSTLLTTVWIIACLKLADPRPQPEVHDEFSYLLGADTFAHGRLANAAPALPQFFAAPHILVRPSYASKYPPGHALVLAVGQVAFGDPYYGVVMECALMVFTISLMLSLWTHSIGAYLVSVAMAIGLLPPMYWSYSYWGGALAASGAAIVLIAVGYSRVRRPALLGAIFALGAAILFLTRPLEGGVFVAMVAIVFRGELRAFLRPPMLVAASPVLLLTVLFVAGLNRATTGSILELPYLAYDRQHNVTPMLWVLPQRPEPNYDNVRLAYQHGTRGWEEESYLAHQPWLQGLLVGFRSSAEVLFMLVHLPPSGVVYLAFLALWVVGYGDRLFRRFAMVVAGGVLGMTFETWSSSHYAAPAMMALAVACALCANRVWKFRAGGVPLGAIATVTLLGYWGSSIVEGYPFPVTPSSNPTRAALIESLLRRKRPQLVLVHYVKPEWNIAREWVYNLSSLDTDPVVFAHDRGSDENAALLKLYGDREVSRLVVSEGGIALEPVPYSPNPSNNTELK